MALADLPSLSLAAGQRTIRWSSGLKSEVRPETLSANGPSPNEVNTTRFTLVTWLPKSLYWQFRRPANIYFLLISVLVCFPTVTTKKWQSKVIPFVAVLLWTALKDLYEDLGRRRDDRLENERVCYRYDWKEREFKRSQWRSCYVGELLLVSKNELSPVDLLLLTSSETKGACYISTASLDGESALKERKAVKVTHSASATCTASKNFEDASTEAANLLHRARVEVLLEAPHSKLCEANGSLVFNEGSPLAQRTGVGVDNFLPRCCVLKNTDWVVGLAAYVGCDTKVHLNGTGAPTKVSDMQISLSRCVALLLLVLFVVCLYFAIAGKVMGGEVSLPILFLKYLVTLYHVVPISLYVMFEVLKLELGRQLNADPLMVDPKTGQHAHARTSDLVEEMGQVGFIFSDKTGTLTANEMRFAFAFVGATRVGPFLPGMVRQPGSVSPEEVRRLIRDAHKEGLGKGALEFFTLLAVCHTVQPDGHGVYQALSPDEVALVTAARGVGLEFVSREGARVRVQGPEPYQTAEFHVAQALEFTSERKRMSVVCTEDDGSATLYTKGADTVLLPLLVNGIPEEASAALQDFAMRGWRTLVCASRRIPKAEYGIWREEWNAASHAVDDRLAKLAVAASKLEVQLDFLGVTAIEDRLQDGVPDTIGALRREAGLRFWVLTGDKVETAIEVARSAQLFDAGMTLHRLYDYPASSEANAALYKAKTGPIGGLVLDGQTLRHILESSASREALYQLGVASPACVCCRLTPLQKKELVQLVREQDPKVVTLAIGDGSNDVSMIQAAHIGVGIRGKEGASAVQAADMAISQFCFLRNLLLCHGRRAYYHVALFLCYYIYKNVVLVWGDLLHAHDIAFSGQIAYPEWLSTTFNALFTSWPVVVVLAFDRDVSDTQALKTPKLYLYGPARKGFNWRVFSFWMLLASFHGSLAWAVPAFFQPGSMHATASERLNRDQDFWIASTVAFTVVVEIVTLKLALMASWPVSRQGKAAMLMAGVVYLVVLFLLGPVGLQVELQPNIPQIIFTHGGPLLCVVLLPALALLPDAAMLVCWKPVRPPPSSASPAPLPFSAPAPSSPSHSSPPLPPPSSCSSLPCTSAAFTPTPFTPAPFTPAPVATFPRSSKTSPLPVVLPSPPPSPPSSPPLSPHPSPTEHNISTTSILGNFRPSTPHSNSGRQLFPGQHNKLASLAY